MKKALLTLLVAVAAGSAATASASVVQSFGSGATVKTVLNAADFELNTALVNDYLEGGLLFHYSGSGQNNGCGYAGVNCYDAPSDLSTAFSGNYLASAGNNAYVSIRRADGAAFNRIEFAVGSGYLNLNGYWRSFNDSVQTGAGNFSAGSGTVLGLFDSAGFDEIRYFAFSSANKSAGFSSGAIDAVRIGVPEPGSLALLGLGLLGLFGLSGRRRQGQP